MTVRPYFITANRRNTCVVNCLKGFHHLCLTELGNGSFFSIILFLFFANLLLAQKKYW